MFRKRTPVEAFWRWFVKNERTLLRADGMEFIERFGERLFEINDGLAYEVGPSTQRPRELVISAEGRAANAQAVEEICDAAPELPEWAIIRFRPPCPSYAGQRVTFERVTLWGESIRVLLLRSERRAVDLALYIDGIGDAGVDQGHLRAAGFILLDQAIGEYNTMFLVGSIDWHPLSEAHEQSFPFDELQARFMDAIERVTGGE